MTGPHAATVEGGIDDFEPFGACWVADDDTSAAHRAYEWALERMAARDIPLSRFHVADLNDPLSMPTLPLPHPADVVVVGVSDAASRRRARALVNLFGCSIVVVPEGHSGGHGILCGVDRVTTAGVTAAAAGVEAEHSRQPLLLLHAVAVKAHPFSARPGHVDPPLRIARTALERHHPMVDLTCRLRSTAAVHALLDESRGRELLVVGGERITSHASVLGELIDRTSIPLLIARGGGSSRLMD